MGNEHHTRLVSSEASHPCFGYTDTILSTPSPPQYHPGTDPEFVIDGVVSEGGHLLRGDAEVPAAEHLVEEDVTGHAGGVDEVGAVQAGRPDGGGEGRRCSEGGGG